MVGLALALRLTLLRNALRSGPGSTGRQLAFGFGLVGGGFLAVLGFTLVAVQPTPAAAQDAAAVLFTALLVGWVVLPILTFSGDDLLDPSRLALLPLTRRQLSTVLLVGGLVGVAPLATLLAALGLVVSGGSPALAALSALLLVLLCVAVSRLTAVALSGLLRSRRGRDLGIGLSLLVALSVQLVNPLLQRGLGSGTTPSSLLSDLAAPLRWTPGGLLARLPAMSAGPALTTLLLGVLLLAAVVLVWQDAVARSLVRVDRAGGRSRRRGGLVPAPLRLLLPRGRVGAVAAKDLRYLLRDPRRLVALLTTLLLPAVALLAGPVYGLGTGVRPELVFVVCLVGLLGGLGGVNRFGIDGTAVWLLVASGRGRGDARRDLLGGDLAVVLTTVPMIVLLGAGVAFVGDGWRYLAAALGLSCALLLTGSGASSWVSVHAAFPVPEDPRNAFAAGAGGKGLLAVLMLMGSMLGVVVLCLPLAALLLPALDSGAWGLALLVVGPLYGAAVGAGLRELGARAWTRRGPEVLLELAAGR